MNDLRRNKTESGGTRNDLRPNSRDAIRPHARVSPNELRERLYGQRERRTFIREGRSAIGVERARESCVTSGERFGIIRYCCARVRSVGFATARK